MKQDFPNAPKYTTFLGLKKEALDLISKCTLAKNTISTKGDFYIDSFKMEACHIKRASRYKTLYGNAAIGYTSMGKFFGFKLHVLINTQGEVLNFLITPGNVADNNTLVVQHLTHFISGNVFGDKGYILNKKLYEKIYKKGVKVVTRQRKNAKTKLPYLLDDVLKLKKRGLIESVGNILKNSLGLEHSRHRSFTGFFIHIFSTLLAYCFRPKKPSLFHHIPSLP